MVLFKVGNIYIYSVGDTCKPHCKQNSYNEGAWYADYNYLLTKQQCTTTTSEHGSAYNEWIYGISGRKFIDIQSLSEYGIDTVRQCQY